MDILFRKIIANLIDLITSLFIKFIVLSLVIFIYKNSITMVMEDFLLQIEGLKDVRTIIINFLQHKIFKIILILIFLFILTGSLYQIYFHSSSWCATIGQRICNILIIRDNGEYLSFLRATTHYILSIIPLLITLYFIIFMAIYSGQYMTDGISNIIKIFSANNFNICLSVAMFCWINIPILAKSKKSVADILCKTKMEAGRTDSKFPKIKF